jgi:hypothetical protein
VYSISSQFKASSIDVIIDEMSVPVLIVPDAAAAVPGAVPVQAVPAVIVQEVSAKAVMLLLQG